MKRTASLGLSITAMLVATPALAASDVFLKFDGVEGEAAAPLAVASWSFGACNAGACSTVTSPREAGSGQASGKRQHGAVRVQASQNTQSLRAAAPQATGDLDGDGLPELSYAATVPEITALTLTIDKATPQLFKVCDGKHFGTVVITRGSDSYEIAGASATCSDGSAASRASGDMPNRISMNVTTPKQSQRSDFGSRCQAGVACAVTVTLTGGQMKHTKTGHVTLLK